MVGPKSASRSRMRGWRPFREPRCTDRLWSDRRGRAHRRRFAAPAFRLRGRLRREPGTARAWLARAVEACPAYADWRELLDREEVDAAVLALPPEVSPDVAIECLRRGLPVLDEKPLAATLRDGRRVARACAKSAAFIQVRVRPAIRRLGPRGRSPGGRHRRPVADPRRRLRRTARSLRRRTPEPHPGLPGQQLGA